MDKYDILYSESTPEVFFTTLIKENQKIINHIFNGYFIHKIFYDHSKLDDLKQEGLLHAWIDLPKNEQQYQKFKAANIKWITWLYNNLSWGASHYLMQIHSKTKVREYSTDVSLRYDLFDDKTYDYRFSSTEYESKLKAVKTAVDALPKTEKKMIDLWLKYGGVSQACKKMNINRGEGLYKYHGLFEILKHDIDSIHSGNGVFKPVQISLQEGLKIGFEYMKDSALRLKIRNAHSQYQAIKRAMFKNQFENMNLWEVDDQICKRIEDDSFLENDTATSKVKRSHLLLHIMHSLVELRFIRLNPLVKRNKYGTPREDLKRRANTTGRDFLMVFMPEKEFAHLEGLANKGNKQATADAIGININNLRRLLDRRFATVLSVDKVIKYLNSLSLTNYTSSETFDIKNRKSRYKDRAVA